MEHLINRRMLKTYIIKRRKLIKKWQDAEVEAESDFKARRRDLKKKAIENVSSRWNSDDDGEPGENNRLWRKSVDYELDTLLSKHPKTESIKRAEDAFREYMDIEKTAIDSILGKYGNKKVKTKSSLYDEYMNTPIKYLLGDSASRLYYE